MCVSRFDCVCVIGFDLPTFLQRGEAGSGVVIIGAALCAAGGAAGPYGYNVSSGRCETSHHTCSVPMREEEVMDDPGLKHSTL